MAFNGAYFKRPSGILKLVEIVMIVVAFVLFRVSDTRFSRTDINADYFGVGVLVTALIITPLLLTCYLMGRVEIEKTVFEMVFNFLMFVFLLAAGSVAINTWNYTFYSKKMTHIKHCSMAMGSFCIMASAAYLADTIFSIINYRK